MHFWSEFLARICSIARLDLVWAHFRSPFLQFRLLPNIQFERKIAALDDPPPSIVCSSQVVSAHSFCCLASQDDKASAASSIVERHPWMSAQPLCLHNCPMCTAPLHRAAFVQIGTIVRHQMCQAEKMANEADDLRAARACTPAPSISGACHLLIHHALIDPCSSQHLHGINRNKQYMPAHLARLSTDRRRKRNAPSLIFRIVYSLTFCDNRTGL